MTEDSGIIGTNVMAEPINIECPKCGYAPLHVRIVHYAKNVQVFRKCALCHFEDSLIAEKEPQDARADRPA